MSMKKAGNSRNHAISAWRDQHGEISTGSLGVKESAGRRLRPWEKSCNKDHGQP